MDVWYAHLDEDELRGAIRSTVAETKKQAKEATKGKKGEQQKLAKIAAKRAEKNAAKAHTRDSLQALSKLGELAGGQYRISASRRSSSRPATWPPPTACPRTRSCR